MTSPKISVVMSVYNGSKYLGEAIDSILNQTFGDFEFIIIDDASQDHSAEIIKSYNDSRIIFIQNPQNMGLTKSLNKGIESARGNYVARMDADDISFKERFHRQYMYLESNPTTVVLGTYFEIVNTKEIVCPPVSHDDIALTLLTSNALCHPSVFIRSSFLLKNKFWYDERFQKSQDYDLWVRICRQGKIENLPEVLLKYRVHESQVSKTHNESQSYSADQIALRQLNDLIDFTDKVYTPEFALYVLTKKFHRINCTQLCALKLLLEQMYKSNKKKGKYNQVKFKIYLRGIWLKYYPTIYEFKFSCLPALFPGRYRVITKMPLYFSLKYLIKSLIGYKNL